MAVELSIPTTAEEIVVTKVTKTIGTVRVRRMILDFDAFSAMLVIAYGDTVNEEFMQAREEVWEISGAYYAGAVEPIAPAVLGAVATEVSRIVSDPVLKAALIENGNLKIN